MMDLSRELLQCMAIAWTCFGAGIVILSCYRRTTDLVWLGKGLVLMCPAILSAFSAHSVRECERIIVAKQRQSEGVNERIYLASTTTADLGDGYQFTSEYYTDGTVVTRGQVPTPEGFLTWDFDAVEGGSEDTSGTPGRLAPLHDGTRIDRYQSDQRRL